jgi:hypothetical protein
MNGREKTMIGIIAVSTVMIIVCVAVLATNKNCQSTQALTGNPSNSFNAQLLLTIDKAKAENDSYEFRPMSLNLGNVALSRPGTTHFIVKVIVDMPFNLDITYPERVYNAYQPTKWTVTPSTMSLDSYTPTPTSGFYNYRYTPGESWKIYKLVDGASIDFKVLVGPKAPPNCSYSALIYGIKLE